MKRRGHFRCVLLSIFCIIIHYGFIIGMIGCFGMSNNHQNSCNICLILIFSIFTIISDSFVTFVCKSDIFEKEWHEGDDRWFPFGDSETVGSVVSRWIRHILKSSIKLPKHKGEFLPRLPQSLTAGSLNLSDKIVSMFVFMCGWRWYVSSPTDTEKIIAFITVKIKLHIFALSESSVNNSWNSLFLPNLIVCTLLFKHQYCETTKLMTVNSFNYI